MTPGSSSEKSFVQQEFDWNVKLPVFEGPLDLLLYLIKKEEIDIYQIPIEKITLQYLEIVRLMQMLDLEVAGEYMVMAATLLYIKSRMLLPKDQQLPEDQEEEDDPRWDLIRQLVEYKKFKDAAQLLSHLSDRQEQIFLHGFDPRTIPADQGSGGGEASIFDLIRAFQKILVRVEPQSEFATILEDRFTVSDKIIFIQQQVSQGNRLLFTQLFPEDASRTEIVVTFLALLELIRLRQILAQQEAAFGEIYLVGAVTTDSVNENPPVSLEAGQS